MSSNNQNSGLFGLIIAMLLLLSAGLGYCFWDRSQTMLEQSRKAEAEKQALTAEKSAIERSLDSLSNAYTSVRTENETLKGAVTSSAALVRQKEVVIDQIRTTTAKDADALRQQVEELKRAKIEYETIIAALQAENAELKGDNARLADENNRLKGEKTELSGQVEGLAKQLEEQIRKTQSAIFKATAFRVEAERRNDKITAKARRVRLLDISFDLADVPPPHQTPQKLYMVITDDKGVPIASQNPVTATITAPTGPIQISAQQVKTVSLEATQRLTFSYPIEEKLKSGHYVVAIYCDKGLLGASSFKLN